jgi:hypothetical protein
MDYGSSFGEDAYLPKRFRRSRANNYSRLSNSIDSSGYGFLGTKFENQKSTLVEKGQKEGTKAGVVFM